MKSRGGWTHFLLFLKATSKKGKKEDLPARGKIKLILEGIHSEGGREIKGWIEVGNYFPISDFKSGDTKSRNPVPARDSLDQEIFHLLSQCVPPGGHFMFAYETFYESPLHEETLIGLSKNIPPICTPQGELLFYSGFRFIKNWYLSEGGLEGPSKLWAEKPLDKDDLARLDLKSFYEILAFLSRNPDPNIMDIEFAARRRALEIMEELHVEKSASLLRKKIIASYRKRFNKQTLGKAARRGCQLIRFALDKSRIKDKRTKKNLLEISENCFESFKHI